MHFDMVRTRVDMHDILILLIPATTLLY